MLLAVPAIDAPAVLLDMDLTAGTGLLLFRQPDFPQIHSFDEAAFSLVRYAVE